MSLYDESCFILTPAGIIGSGIRSNNRVLKFILLESDGINCNIFADGLCFEMNGCLIIISGKRF